MTGIRSLLEEFGAWSTPREGVGDSPLRLACKLSEPASEQEIRDSWPGGSVPDDILEVWRVCREASLFVDVDYGQWGLHILTPRASAVRSVDERVARSADFGPYDIVLGEFLGDQELLVVASDGNGNGVRILIALPLYERPEWFRVETSLEGFLRQYLANLGEKFWE